MKEWNILEKSVKERRTHRRREKTKVGNQRKRYLERGKPRKRRLLHTKTHTNGKRIRGKKESVTKGVSAFGQFVSDKRERRVKKKEKMGSVIGGGAKWVCVSS